MRRGSGEVGSMPGAGTEKGQVGVCRRRRSASRAKTGRSRSGDGATEQRRRRRLSWQDEARRSSGMMQARYCYGGGTEAGNCRRPKGPRWRQGRREEDNDSLLGGG